MQPGASPSDPPSSASREWWVIVALTVVAAGLRLWGFGRCGLTHFDEGVYASSGLWVLSPRGIAALDPSVVAYAPPGFPVLIGLAYGIFGVGDAPALAVAITCGVLTIPVVAWVGRRTFGPGAGAAAAALAALAVAHVAFSRKALTDAPFLLAWIAALGLGGWFLERPRTVRAVAFGLAVGLAQNLKYNGWIAGAVVALAALAGLVARPDARRPEALRRTFGLVFLAACVAGACYAPWYRFVERQPGGYADLVRHHRSYLGGFRSWWPHWRIQLAEAVALSGGIGWGYATWLAAWFAAALALNGLRLVPVPRRRADDVGALVCIVSIGGWVFAFLPDLGWWAGLASAPWLVCDARPAQRVLGAWWVTLSVMTPFYHPYARLWLPLHAAGWLILAGVITRLVPSREGDARATRRVRRDRVWQTVWVVCCLSAARTHWLFRPPNAFPVSAVLAPTDGLRSSVAEFLASEWAGATRGGLWTYGRRPMAYYLAVQGGRRVKLLNDLHGLAVPGPPDELALVDDLGPEQGSQTVVRHEEVLAHWTPLRSWPNRLDPVTLLDVNPNAAFEVWRGHEVPLVLFGPGPQSTLTPESRP